MSVVTRVEPAPAPGAVPAAAMNPRTVALLHAPIVATLLRLAWPNVLVMLAQSSTGLIETYWVSRLGTDALAGMALVFPGVMLMQMMSNGAMGGGVSSAIARALGGRRQADADALVLHALVLSLVVAAVFSAAVLAFGPALYRLMGGSGASLATALAYSNVVFAGMVLLWMSNALASVLRGTGNMLVPSIVTIVGVVLLVPVSPCLIFGIGPFPKLGVAGAGYAMLLYYVGSTAVLAWYVLAGRASVMWRWVALRWRYFREILSVAVIASLTSIQTNLAIAVTTGLVGAYAGSDAVAGYGTGSRLEYLLIPLTFGLGGPLVAVVGANIGAGQHERAVRAAWIGGALAFAMTEAIGLAAAIWPVGWLGLFGTDPAMLATGAAYLRAVGPAYGFYGGGLALYFACQGAGRLFWPLVAGLTRTAVAIGGGWLALWLTGSLDALFVALALGLVVFGGIISLAPRIRAWQV